jgi:hypothetical protein
MTNASAAQIKRIEDFLSARQLYCNEYDRLWNQLEAHRINERTPGDGTPISADRADLIWAWLHRNAPKMSQTS